MTSESISVVIPAFNAARFLADALRSVLAQSLLPVEVIVVDDGSTDATAEIARQFAGVSLLQLPHLGVSVARNAGVGAATGDLLAFLDADDTWHPEKLAMQADVLAARTQVGIVMCQQAYRFEGPIPPWFRGPRDGSAEPGYVPSAWLMRRSTWEAVGEFAPGMTHSEDTDWLARAKDLGVGVAEVDQVLLTRRIHDANASGMAADVRSGVLKALRDSVHRKHQVPS